MDEDNAESRLGQPLVAQKSPRKNIIRDVCIFILVMELAEVSDRERILGVGAFLPPPPT